MLILVSLLALAGLALVGGVAWRARAGRTVPYPELERPLSTTPGRHKLVK